ncbi:MAG TPA: DUF4157 domain-containing protein [Candidatus Binatia bacterium]|nr:DUF4157 domain-containing protein [Candidatus Binatia bacterium]
MKSAVVAHVKKAVAPKSVVQRCSCGGTCAPCSQHVASAVDTGVKSAWQPLGTSLRSAMQSRLGGNFSRVRVHANEHAEESAKGFKALAYTLGNDIVFGAGQYAPNTTRGNQLLAHELTHIVQQDAIEHVRRQPDDSVSASLPPAVELDQQYQAALQDARQTGDWTAAAEKLNGFNYDDIQNRLAQMSPDEVGYLHLGALDNPDVGPQSQVAQLTQPGTTPASTATSAAPTEPSAPDVAAPSAGLAGPNGPEVAPPSGALAGPCMPEAQADAIELSRANATLTKSRTVADTIIGPGATSDLGYWFAELYFYITQGEIAQRARFQHPAFVMHFIPTFYDMYAVNAEEFSKGDFGKIAPNWQGHFAWSSIPANPNQFEQYLLEVTASLVSGVRAHIIGDMPAALANAYLTYALDYCEALPFDCYRLDFFDLNKPIFVGVRQNLINELINRPLAIHGMGPLSPDFAGTMGDRLGMGLNIDEVYAWRSVAWEQAKGMIKSQGGAAEGPCQPSR